MDRPRTRAVPLLALLLAAVFLAACGGGGGGGDGGALPPPPPPPPPPPSEPVPGDILAIHDQDLTKATVSCQAADCHPNQMEQLAPHAARSGQVVTNFHYMKVAILSRPFFGYFEGRGPDQTTDQDCTFCHKRVQLRARSGATADGASLHLRRMVDVEFCATCHDSDDVATPLYMR